MRYEDIVNMNGGVWLCNVGLEGYSAISFSMKPPSMEFVKYAASKVQYFYGEFLEIKKYVHGVNGVWRCDEVIRGVQS